MPYPRIISMDSESVGGLDLFYLNTLVSETALLAACRVSLRVLFTISNRISLL